MFKLRVQYVVMVIWFCKLLQFTLKLVPLAQFIQSLINLSKQAIYFRHVHLQVH